MTINWIELDQVPILDQLRLEEALIRTDQRNFCIVNRRSPKAIVMGISGKAEELIDIEKVQKDPIPVIKRFSGGGTVVVDENTLFITFILNKTALPISPFPEAILRWSASLYTNCWQIPSFHLVENDYVIGEKKCGGNAQYIRKDRWLHHTSFLWDYESKNMEYLLFPSKRPAYRQNRSHLDFLCKLKEHAPSEKTLIENLRSELVKQLYIQDFDLKTFDPPEHRRTTELLAY